MILSGYFTIGICGKGREPISLEDIFETQMKSAYFPKSLRT